MALLLLVFLGRGKREVKHMAFELVVNAFSRKRNETKWIYKSSNEQ